MGILGPAFAGEADPFIQKGDQAIREKNFKEAARAYENAVKHDPANAKAHLMLGLSYAKLDRLDEAVEQSRMALRLKPSYTAYQNLGLIHARRGDYEKAIENYEKALRLDGSSHAGWYQLGLMHAASGRFGRAIRCYNAALKHNPEFTDAYLGLGSAYYWSGDKATARDQARILRDMHQDKKAEALEAWIKKKESGALPADRG